MADSEPKKKELSLKHRWTADLGAALCTGFALSFLIAPMDSAVTENMSGKSTITSSLRSSFKTILTRPHQYMRRPEFGIIFGVYGATYMSKNGIDSYCDFKNMSNEQTAFLKFWGVLGLFQYPLSLNSIAFQISGNFFDKLREQLFVVHFLM